MTLPHEGPPYPVLVDQPVAPYTLSVWTDRDVGIGTFFVLFDPDAYLSPGDPAVSVEVWPASGRLPATRHPAPRQKDRAYRADVPFDREEPWQVRILIDGSKVAASTTVEVLVTPPGYGRWDSLIYLSPSCSSARPGWPWPCGAGKRRPQRVPEPPLAPEKRD